MVNAKGRMIKIPRDKASAVRCTAAAAAAAAARARACGSKGSRGEGYELRATNMPAHMCVGVACTPNRHAPLQWILTLTKPSLGNPTPGPYSPNSES